MCTCGHNWNDHCDDEVCCGNVNGDNPDARAECRKCGCCWFERKE